MRIVVTLSFLAAVWALLPACGGAAIEDVLPACGANTCGRCADGLVAHDTCTSGKWSCSCVPPVDGGQCAAAPTCGPDENQFATEALCRQNSTNACHANSICGSTVWCAKRHTPNDDAVWPPSATTFVATDEGGGFVPSPPPGSACKMGEAHFTYTRSSHVLVWQVCDSNVAPYVVRSSSRALSQQEASNVESAMSALTVTTDTNRCGADKSVLWVSVTTPNGTKKYLDSFYVCNQQGTYVDNIDGVFSVLRKAAGP